jgi:3-phenylpropionate/trans-cinnamate dioxygenase ferredoxin subunit
VSEIRITATENGPYKVEGPIELHDQAGEPIPVPAGRPVFLCRCGGSENKPFCDGTHSRIGFQGAMAAVERAEESTS